METQSVPLRNYLMTHVMPTLTKGLIECCKQKPDDPIDYLVIFVCWCLLVAIFENIHTTFSLTLMHSKRPSISSRITRKWTKRYNFKRADINKHDELFGKEKTQQPQELTTSYSLGLVFTFCFFLFVLTK